MFPVSEPVEKYEGKLQSTGEAKYVDDIPRGEPVDDILDDIMGTKDGWLAVLISGAPYFSEGRVIGIPSLVDEDGNPTSTGQAQFEGCVELIEE